MIKYFLMIIFVSVAMIILVTGCNKGKSPFPTVPSVTEAPMGPDLTPRIIETYLKEFARTLALTVADQNVQGLLHQEIGKKFDGQFEVLYHHVSLKKVDDNHTFSARLMQSRRELMDTGALKKPATAAEAMEIESIATQLESVMNLQLFMPFYPAWDGQSAPLVAYLPQEIDDNKITEFTAFDAARHSIVIPVERAHEYQYIIVGANERTDENGELLADIVFPMDGKYQDIDENSLAKKAQSEWDIPGPGPRPDGWESRLYRIRVTDDMEPYVTNGDPEISIKFKPFKGMTGDILYNFDHCFDGHWHFLIHHDWDSDWYYTGCTILSHWRQVDFSKYIAFCVYERDGGAKIDVKFDVPVGGAKLSTSFQIEDKDDILFQHYIDWADDNNREYYSPSCVLMISYREPR
jgi:hypothetical protein